jgi:sec-independent protein translocase protein TatB
VGFSLGEIILLLVVGLIVVGPRRLPGLMRTAGQWVARLRRMSMDLRSQSGIDDLIRQEGLEQHLTELRSLSRMNVVDTLIAPAVGGAASPMAPMSPRPAKGALARRRAEPLREREYPLVGCDAYGALPDDNLPYIPPRPHAPIEPVAPAATAAPAAEPAADAVPSPAPDAALDAAAAGASPAPADHDATPAAGGPGEPAERSDG